MKWYRIVFLHILTVCWFVPQIQSFSAGPFDGYTGGPGQFTCMQCHQNFPGDGSVALIGVPDSYIAGMEYPMEIVLEDSGQNRWGFEITAMDDNIDAAGEFTVTDTINTQLSDNDDPILDYVKHTRDGTYQGTPDGPVNWQFTWTAPVTTTGKITFYLAALGADGTGTNENDFVYLANRDSLPETAASPTPAPSFTPVHGSPTPSPTPCMSMGVTLLMPSDQYRPGDTCYLDAEICNTAAVTLLGYPLFVVLDVYGNYWFAPSWSALEDGLDWYITDFPPGGSTLQVLPVFTWPTGVGSGSGVIFWGALTDPEMTVLIGAFDRVEISWYE
jgi:hypothetical protein